MGLVEWVVKGWSVVNNKLKSQFTGLNHLLLLHEGTECWKVDVSFLKDVH